jgi:hypothetical protein
MDLETINKLYLELSQFATAKTAKELALEEQVKNGREAIEDALMHLDTNYDADGNSMKESDASRVLHDWIDLGKPSRV